MAESLQSGAETTDPRVLRSRRMLMDSLAKLLIKKDFEDISVQEIADGATLTDHELPARAQLGKQQRCGRLLDSKPPDVEDVHVCIEEALQDVAGRLDDGHSAQVE